MSPTGYMIWFLATAAMTIVVLAVGTLAAAGLLRREEKRPSTTTNPGGPRQDRTVDNAGPPSTTSPLSRT